VTSAAGLDSLNGQVTALKKSVLQLVLNVMVTFVIRHF
jgi:hypothetical protein